MSGNDRFEWKGTVAAGSAAMYHHQRNAPMVLVLGTVQYFIHF
jgi:hypothetical protein